jgi:DinB superfamily
MDQLARQAIYDELSAAQDSFEQLVATMTADDLRRRTNGTRWTNREMLFHMLFGYFVVRALLPLVKAFGHLPRPASRAFAAILNAGTRPFHPINYFGSWMGGHMSPTWMRRRMDRVTQKLARRLARESDRSLARGMCFPVGWDPFFKPYMTLREVYHYPTEHFEFHRGQLALGEPEDH